MKLILLRHTRVDRPVGWCYGQTDVGLAPTFETEAETVCRQLKGHVFTHCFSSPLQRCTLLAEKLCGALPVKKDPRLMEMHFGDWEDRPWTDFDPTPEAHAWFADFLHQPCPGGESFDDLFRRVQSFYAELSLLPADSSVLTVTHGGVVRAFRVLCGDASPEDIFGQPVDNGSVLMLDYVGLDSTPETVF